MSNPVEKQAPLEDLMAAMDVVDTLRHQQDIASRELDGEGRRERLLRRLKQLYQAQGIEVPGHILQEGIDALEQERFKYMPIAPDWRMRIANMWVSRGRWGKPVGFLVVLASLFFAIYFVSDVLPQRQLRAELPLLLDESMSSIRAIAKNPETIALAASRADAAKRALADNELATAQTIQQELIDLSSKLQTTYRVRVLSRPDVSSGVWRIPDVNQSGRNYYLIVEAIGSNNESLAIEILSEETNKSSRVKSWGIRVDEATFFKIAADKNDDGIIQGNRVGEKLAGYLQPRYFIATTGGTITEW